MGACGLLSDILFWSSYIASGFPCGEFRISGPDSLAFLPSLGSSLGALFFVHLSRWTRHLSQQPMYQSPSTVNPPHSSMAPSLPSAVSSLLQPLEAQDISSYTEDNFPFSHLSLKSGEQGRSTFCAPAEDKALYFHSDVGLLGKQ